MKKVALHNLGCKVNAYETEAMQELLEKHGYEIVPFQEGADVYIIKDEGKKDLLLPALKSVVNEIDLDGKKVRVTVPEGLM